MFNVGTANNSLELVSVREVILGETNPLARPERSTAITSAFRGWSIERLLATCRLRLRLDPMSAYFDEIRPA